MGKYSTKLLVSLSTLSFSAHAAPPEQSVPSLANRTKTFLRAFKSNPKKQMNAIPLKYDPKSNTLIAPPSPFSSTQIRQRQYVELKDKQRSQSHNLPASQRRYADVISGGAYEDVVSYFDGATPIQNLMRLEEQGLNRGQVSKTPWSDDYWAYANGSLARRYADQNFPVTHNWQAAFNYGWPSFTNILAALGDGRGVTQRALNILSPAEKYDVLTGSTTGKLTRSNWRTGERYYNEQGRVETWMGICHGWAAASYMLDRPERAIHVTAADKRTEIKFYPSDIKALSSLLWAETPSASLYLGGRCNESSPRTDANGRILSSNCFDTNPGSWHVAITNKVGREKKTFVFDATYDYQVWNQPVYSYSTVYFNPITQATSNRAANAIVDLRQYRNDPFARYRSPRAKYIVGVSMDVTYMVETNPVQNNTDSANNDRINTAMYAYDLELDEHYNIVGGEWLQNAHPDFLWTPKDRARAVTQYDRNLGGEWNAQNEAFPSQWVSVANEASARNQPLAKVIEALIRASKQQ